MRNQTFEQALTIVTISWSINLQH